MKTGLRIFLFLHKALSARNLRQWWFVPLYSLFAKYIRLVLYPDPWEPLAKTRVNRNLSMRQPRRGKLSPATRPSKHKMSQLNISSNLRQKSVSRNKKGRHGRGDTHVGVNVVGWGSRNRSAKPPDANAARHLPGIGRVYFDHVRFILRLCCLNSRWTCEIVFDPDECHLN